MRLTGVWIWTSKFSPALCTEILLAKKIYVLPRGYLFNYVKYGYHPYCQLIAISIGWLLFGGSTLRDAGLRLECGDWS